MKIPYPAPRLLRIPPPFEKYVEEDLIPLLRPRIRYHQRRLVLGDRQTQWLVTPAAWLGTVMLLAAVLGPGLILYLVGRGMTEAAVATAAGYGLTMAGYLPIYLRIRAQRYRLSSRESARLFVHLLVRSAIIVSLSLSLSAIVYSTTTLHPLLRFGGSAALLVPGLTVLAMFINLWIVGKASRVQSGRRNRDYADSALVAAYLRILNALPADQRPRREFENRRRLIAEMDLVVDLLGRGLPQFVRPVGSPVDEEARRTFRRMATAQRMQKRLVYFPAGGSVDELGAPP